MSSSSRRRDTSPSKNLIGSSKLRMDRQPIVTRISDPSLNIGRRKEIDNVMKKARANTNDYWDKKLLEVEEKDPNRWRHSGYKKMYIEGESSSDSERETFRFNRGRNSRSRSRNRKSPPMSPGRKRASPFDVRRKPLSPPSQRGCRTPDMKRPRSPEMRRRPRSPPEPPSRRKSRSPRSPIGSRKQSPSPSTMRRNSIDRRPMHYTKSRSGILPRSKRPPSPPPKGARTPSNSSVSSCSDDSCSVCSPKSRRRSTSPHPRHAPLSPSPRAKGNGRNKHQFHGQEAGRSGRPMSPAFQNRNDEKQRNHSLKNHRGDDKYSSHGGDKEISRERLHSSRNHVIEDSTHHNAAKHAVPATRSKVNRPQTSEYSRSRNPPEPIIESPIIKKRPKEKSMGKIKIEGEKRRHKEREKDTRRDSSDSDESGSSESSFPNFAATTRLTLSERFGKMAQWSVDRSNMENMRITKDSSGGALKVMIEEDLEATPRRYSYSPAPQGHFPEELATTAPTGLMSWDDVRVRYEYYKSRGYLRDLDLKDYVKWEEWWYRYQEWLKQERYYEFYERQQMNRRRRKKIPITQRLN